MARGVVSRCTSRHTATPREATESSAHDIDRAFFISIFDCTSNVATAAPTTLDVPDDVDCCCSTPLVTGSDQRQCSRLRCDGDDGKPQDHGSLRYRRLCRERRRRAPTCTLATATAAAQCGAWNRRSCVVRSSRRLSWLPHFTDRRRSEVATVLPRQSKSMAFSFRC